MFPSNKKADPKHHNYGRAQTDRGRFSARLSWMRFQLLATYGNLSSARHQIAQEFGKVEDELKESHRIRFYEIQGELRTLTARAKALSDEIAELNSPDKWID